MAMRCHPTWRVTVVLCLAMGEWLLAILSCAPKIQVPPPPEPAGEPLLRVGILQNMDQVTFSCAAGFRVVDDLGKIVFSSGSTGLRWTVRVKFGQPASTVYRLALYEEKRMDSALRRANEVRDLGLKPKIIEVGQELRLGTRLLNDNRKYWVCIGPYTAEEEARSPGKRLPSQALRLVIPEISSPPLGVLDLVNPSGHVVLSSGEPIVLESKNPREEFFTFHQVPVGLGFSWERQEDRSYRGKVEFRVGNDGKVLAIDELSLEDYLKGVLPAEMNPGFPPEALRAQAIAARSVTIAKMGNQHRLDPFDLCADVHCQAYGGAGKEHPATNQAVDETRGQVLLYGGEVCDAVYSAVCGGHTESSTAVWGGSPVPYLTARPDAPPEEALGFPTPLDCEEAVRDWVTSTPAAFCNHLSVDAPSALRYTRRHFRWSFTYSRQELEQIIALKTKEEIGNLLDILPVSRGPSGRIIVVRIVGDADELVLEGELKIRRLLSATYLPSACFVVDKRMGPDGLPDVFVLQGAGWGHGVGMCQAGAAGMALHGMGHREILSHYYQGAEVVEIYGTIF